MIFPLPFAYYERLSPARRRIYDRSDAIVTLPLPEGLDLTAEAAAVTEALVTEREAPVQKACARLLNALVEVFAVPPLKVRVFAVRPNGDWGELHGLYLPAEDGVDARVEVWMRTVRHQRVVAPRTFLRTVLHEFCHHLDYEHFGLEETFHTEGFYKRESHLLTQLAGPPARGRGSRPQPAADLASGSSDTTTGTRGASAQSSS
jgi:hypothetical protein